MDGAIKVLLFEDTAADAELLIREMRSSGLEVAPCRVDTREALERALAQGTPDVILSDYSVPGFDGMNALALVREVDPHTPFIFVSGTIGEERAIDALKQGATDYVLKDSRARLVPAIRRALSEAAERRKRREAEDAQRASEERFRTIAEATQEWIWETDAVGVYTYCNPAVIPILGHPPGALIGRNAFDLIHDDDRRAALELAGGSDRSRAGWNNRVLRWRHANGGVRWLESSGMPLYSSSREIVGYRGADRDITERILQERKIARLHRIRAVLGAINSTILRVHDRAELCRDACRIAVEIGGFRMAWIGLVEADHPRVRPVAWAGDEDGFLIALAASIRENAEPGIAPTFTAPEKRPVIANDIESDPRTMLQSEALARGYRAMTSLPLIVEDETVGVLVLYAAESNFFNHGEIRLLRDVAADISLALTHIAKDEKLAFISYYDPLTGLANRQLFLDRLAQLVNGARAQGRDAAVVRFDIQRFRGINDTLGQSAGDEVLRQTAARLGRIFPESATLARLGGDQFAVAVGDLRGPALALLFEAWSEQFAAEPFVIEGLELRAAMKIGVALFPADGETAESLFVNAEVALWRAKDSTDSYAFYSPEMNKRMTHRLHLESRLRNAVAHKQFTLHYQPKLDLRTGALQGLEALMRWRDAERGMISPLEFIPLLEETGMIIDVGRWAIEQVVADSQNWRNQGRRVPRIAVNVSQAQLHHKDFVAAVFAALGPAERRASNIDIEITESMFMQDAQASAEKLGALRAIGMRVFIDDFGTGYCNLGQLAKLPLDALKIDQTFIARISTHAQDRTIVSTIIGLAKAMSIIVVAEGVETEEQAAALRSLGCDQAQGYLFSRALPPEDIAKMLAAT